MVQLNPAIAANPLSRKGKDLANRLIVLCFLVLWVAGCSDVLPFSGGRLEGNLADSPQDWTELASREVIQLETNPENPYSVNLWIVGEGTDLYVHAGANRAAWVENMEADPDVRLLIGDMLYELKGERVTSQAEFDAFADAYEGKYGRRPRNENVGEAYLFRLIPRE